LEEDKTYLLSVISGNGYTAIYIDGRLMNSFPNFSLMTDERGLSGNLILGNSPDGRHTWNGEFLGLAIYDRAVTDKEVLDNYHAWQQHQLDRGRLGNFIMPTALYLFDEHGGQQIRNHASNRYHLLIPRPFQPLHRNVLEVPRREYWLTRSNLIDVSINILGFIPFGFFLTAWLRQSINRSAPRAYNISIILGFCISITIELAQAYLPTRDSSLLDVFDNTLGTIVGILLLKYALPIFYKIKGARALSA